jgi:hypothetical protein
MALVREEEEKQSRLQSLKRFGFALELLLLAYIARRSFAAVRDRLRA